MNFSAKFCVLNSRGEFMNSYCYQDLGCRPFAPFRVFPMTTEPVCETKDKFQSGFR